MKKILLVGFFSALVICAPVVAADQDQPASGFDPEAELMSVSLDSVPQHSSGGKVDTVLLQQIAQEHLNAYLSLKAQQSELVDQQAQEKN